MHSQFAKTFDIVDEPITEGINFQIQVESNILTRNNSKNY